jgi:hypothetical protein
MTVPKTSIDEYHALIFWQSKIGAAGKVFAVQAKSQSAFMKSTPD